MTAAERTLACVCSSLVVKTVERSASGSNAATSSLAREIIAATCRNNPDSKQQCIAVCQISSMQQPGAAEHSCQGAMLACASVPFIWDKCSGSHQIHRNQFAPAVVKQSQEWPRIHSLQTAAVGQQRVQQSCGWIPVAHQQLLLSVLACACCTRDDLQCCELQRRCVDACVDAVAA